MLLEERERERRGWKDKIQDLGSSDHRENWAAELQTCVTHSHFSRFVCVCSGGGDDNRQSEIGHGYVYYKLLFFLQVPVPQHFISTGSCAATKAHATGGCCYLAP